MGSPTLLGVPAAGLGPPKPVRIVTKCNSVDEFVHTFRRLVDERSIFVLMKTPRAVGPPMRFSIQLADGTAVLNGTGAVLESRPASESPAQPGMRIELAGLDQGSKHMHTRLLQARSALLATRSQPVPAAPASPPHARAMPRDTFPEDPPPVPAATPPPIPALAKAPMATPPPIPSAMPALAVPPEPPPAAAVPAPVAVLPAPAPPVLPASAGPVDALGPTMVPPPPPSTIPPSFGEPDTAVTQMPPDMSAGPPAPAPAVFPRAATPLPGSEQRAPHSAFTLPANPFGELEDDTLAAFVECTIYEDSGVFPPVDQIGPAAEPEINEAAPLRTASGSTPPLGSRTPPLTPPQGLPAVAVTPAGAPAPLAVPALGTPLPGPRPMVMPPEDTIAPPPRRMGLAIALLVVGLAVGLGVGYVLGARGDSDDEPAPPAMKTEAPPPKNPATAQTPAGAEDPAATAAPAAAEPAATADPAAEPAATADPAAEPAAAAAAAADPPVEKALAEPPSAPAGGDGGTCLVTVRTLPPGAKVTAGTTVLGVTPFVDAPAPCGPSTLVLERPRYERVERQVELVAGPALIVDERLARPDGVLSLVSTPPGASFTVDGAPATPGGHKVLAYTFVTVTASMPGYKPWSQKVYVRGRAARAVAVLQPGARPRPTGPASSKPKAPAPAPR